VLDKGVKPELEVWYTDQLWLLKLTYLIQFVMGFQSGACATSKGLLHMLDSAPMQSVFFVLGVGSLQAPMITVGILSGLDVRTGMEDNLYYRRHEPCKDNAQLVEKVVRIAREPGREIATPKEARQILGLSEKPSQY